MDLTITIPKELEPVLEYWQKYKGVDMEVWLTGIAVGNLESEATVNWVEEQDKVVTLDEKVRAVDYTAKVTAISATMEVVEMPVEMEGVPSEIKPG